MRSSRPSRNSTGKRFVQIDHARVSIEAEDLLQARQVLDRVVEEIVAVLERHSLRDDVQQVELAHPDRQAELDDLIDVGNVLLVDAHVDVDDDASFANRPHHRLHQLVKGARSRGQAVVQLRGVAVQAEGDLAEPGVDRRLVELALAEHHTVGHGLDAAVAELLGVGDVLDELGVNRRLAAGQDDLVRLELVAAALDLALDVVFEKIDAARRVGIEAEHTAAVARRHQTHPMLAHVGDALALEHAVF